MILTITSGAGGIEANDWASMLLRMYTRFANRRSFTPLVLSSEPGPEKGIVSAVLSIEGEGAYDALRDETGVHRLVRKSPHDPERRRHTTFAAVRVSERPEPPSPVGPEERIGWPDTVRSYMVSPLERVVDHRTGATTDNVRGVLDGNLSMFAPAPSA